MHTPAIGAVGVPEVSIRDDGDERRGDRRRVCGLNQDTCSAGKKQDRNRQLQQYARDACSSCVCVGLLGLLVVVGGISQRERGTWA